jgi:pimeloyl-ACP methyl ester carboxylesterase
LYEGDLADAADCRYWDLSYNDYNYSYVETAVRSGFATLAIDRLGIGNSSHGDPLNVIQAQAEVEALNEITKKLRSGEVDGIEQPFRKVVHVGHSFGSIQSYWLSSLYPNNTDGLVLTGWTARGDFLASTIAAWELQSARLNQPMRFGNSSNEKVREVLKDYASSEGLVNGLQTLLQGLDIELSAQDIWDGVATTVVGNFLTGYNESIAPLDYPPGYTAHSSAQGNQHVMGYPGFFDTALLLLTEATKQPVTVGELLTIGSSPPTTSFTGPVLVYAPENDQPFCGGNCLASETKESIPAEAEELFPDAEPFEAYIQPNTGHGMAMHYNATAGYEFVQGWLVAHGLEPTGDSDGY